MDFFFFFSDGDMFHVVIPLDQQQNQDTLCVGTQVAKTDATEGCAWSVRLF